MIRVNLLGEHRKRKVIAFKVPSGPPKPTLLVLLFVVVFLSAGGYLFYRYQSLTSESAKLANQIQTAQQEKQRKQKLLNEIEQFKKEKQSLDDRIAIIDELKRNQLGPIEWLNALGGAIDRNRTVWLNSVGQTGDRISLEGVATSMNGVANFVTTLKQFKVFKDVVINESYQTEVMGLQGFVFTIDCDLSPAGKAAKI
ncbi:MAG: PilN domain-containing protein [Acidobacteriia bacterium]|nr:PilN domain-containing protein [Terriglobia bacterium]